jgi:hypothetical protein
LLLNIVPEQLSSGKAVSKNIEKRSAILNAIRKEKPEEQTQCGIDLIAGQYNG